MAAKVRGVKLTGADGQQRLGAMVSARHVYSVTGCSGANALEKMKDALDALETLGISFGVRSTTFPNLMVGNISPKLVEQGPTTSVYDVSVEFMDIGTLEGIGIISTQTSLTSRETTVDYDGRPLTVSCYFPPEYNDPDIADSTVTQVVSAQQLVPIEDMTATKIFACSNIGIWARKYRAHVNNATWHDRPIGQWLCTGIVTKLHDAQTNPIKWLVQVSFQGIDAGHQQFIRFVASSGYWAGTTPPTAVSGTGYRYAILQPGADFSTMFSGG